MRVRVQVRTKMAWSAKCGVQRGVENLVAENLVASPLVGDGRSKG